MISLRYLKVFKTIFAGKLLVFLSNIQLLLFHLPSLSVVTLPFQLLRIKTTNSSMTYLFSMTTYSVSCSLKREIIFHCVSLFCSVSFFQSGLHTTTSSTDTAISLSLKLGHYSNHQKPSRVFSLTPNESHSCYKSLKMTVSILVSSTPLPSQSASVLMLPVLSLWGSHASISEWLPKPSCRNTFLSETKGFFTRLPLPQGSQSWWSYITLQPLPHSVLVPWISPWLRLFPSSL